ncbi:hypothetical protein CLV30_103239 [Haloactinopolyspora alba]|uniref:ACT domain-containing protein n=1 Tax=Haloactinopolyspora alba TaxID=648780 RepID=A0A2P8E9F9_9ACTN|nr:hypothetical protein CLV30_103239 [Haloactinopolyspora alba]
MVPDQPGSLGAVASAVGMAGGDIVGVDVVEHRADGTAVDDFLIDLPAGKLPDTLVSACLSVDDVDVEFVGHYSPGAGLHRDLEAVEAMTEDPRRALEVLVDLLPGVFRSGWALLLAADGSTLRVERAAGGAPEADGYEAPWLPLATAARLPTHEGWAPESWHDVVAVGAPVASTGQTVVFGRDGGPRILDSELARLAHLVALAQVVGRGPQSPGLGQRERQHLGGSGVA